MVVVSWAWREEGEEADFGVHEARAALVEGERGGLIAIERRAKN
jgi:hypothetical protein